MAYSRRKKSIAPEQKMEEKNDDTTLDTEEVKLELPEDPIVEEPVTIQEPPRPTGKIFVGEEDKRLLKKFNSHIVKKLGVSGNRSYKV